LRPIASQASTSRASIIGLGMSAKSAPASRSTEWIHISRARIHGTADARITRPCTFVTSAAQAASGRSRTTVASRSEEARTSSRISLGERTAPFSMSATRASALA
jgi:hypothetical protein